jgi:hypothetical protein
VAQNFVIQNATVICGSFLTRRDAGRNGARRRSFLLGTL